MIESIAFIILSIIWIIVLRTINTNRSEKLVFALKYILMIITGYQYYSIFVYGGKIKGGYTAEDIFLFQDFLVKALQLPSYIQFFAFAIFLFVCFFCHPKHKNGA
ncbi:TPA: hypothetical protein ACNFL6_003570 [Vibrio cholerae]